MLRSLKGFDWKKSKAHWFLLSKFIHPQNPNDFTKSDIWKNILGEKPVQSIKRFLDEGLIITADLKNVLAYKYKVTELKDMLKQRGLPVSGRKDDMVERLETADPVGMKKLITGLTAFECTQRGRELTEKFLSYEREKHSHVEQQVLEYIKRRMFKKASLAVASYEAEQVFPRGIGIDWKHYNPANDVKMMNTIFNGKPKILSKLSDTKLEIIRQGAAMMKLWGKNTAKEWVPPDFETGLSLDVDTVARMFSFYASHKATLDQFRKSGVVKHVKILTMHDSCDACKKMARKKYKLSEMPELPYEHCTHEMGCRCTEIAVVQ